MDQDLGSITVHQFLNVLFPKPKGIVDLVEARPGGENKLFFVDHNAQSYDARQKAILYYCISTCEALNPRSRKPSRQHPVATYVIVLDDVGTKVKAESITVRPTYALETSPKNFQLGYRLTDPVDPDRGRALMDALAKAGLTDRQTKSNVRIMRVPGSWNGKAQHGDWRARLSTWNPEISYTFSELALAFKVTPTDTVPLSSVPDLEEGQVDPIAEWIVDHQGELGAASGPTTRGLIPLRCPQEHLHTVAIDRSNDTSTVWKPGAPGYFKCTHAHCENFRTREYLDWLRKHHPTAPVDGQATDLEGLGEALRKARDAMGGRGGIFQPPEADRARIVSNAILSDLVKVGSEDKYFTITGNAFLSRAAIDDHWLERLSAVGLLNSTTPSGRPTVIAPHVWLRRQREVRRASKLVHRLGHDLLTEGDLNIAPAIPQIPQVPGDPLPWLELVDYMSNGNGEHYDLLLDWMAMVAGCWTEKPGWHLLMTGGQGVGKNLMLAPLRHWLGTDHHQRVDVSMIGDKYQPFLTKKLVTIDEIKMTTRGAATMHDIYTTLKAWTTRGNFFVEINDKYLKRYSALDLSAWALTSNEAVPMPLDVDDRRFFVLEPPPQPRAKGFYEKLVSWGEAGGWLHVVSWLVRQWQDLTDEQRSVLRGSAPGSKAKLALIEGAAEGIQGAIKLATEGAFGIAWPELMTIQDVRAQFEPMGSAAGLLPDSARRGISDQRIAVCLRSAGWVRLHDGRQVEHGGTALRLWCRSAQRAKLYEQMGQGKRVIDTYKRLKAGQGRNVAGIIRPQFPSRRDGQDEDGENED